MKILDYILGLCNQFRFFPVILIRSFERQFLSFEGSALSLRKKGDSRFIVSPGCPAVTCAEGH